MIAKRDGSIGVTGGGRIRLHTTSAAIAVQPASAVIATGVMRRDGIAESAGLPAA